MALAPLCGQAATAACGAPNASNARACSIDGALDPGALCNDHSLPAYWYRPGTGSGAKQWVIWLEGGGDCLDQASCAARASSNAPFITSTGFGPNGGFGVTSFSASINPKLYNANTVVVHYCSSDSWSGDKRAESGVAFDPAVPATWYFRGRRIAIAAVKTLAESVPALASADKILIGGSSAGGEGITLVANDIIPLLPSGAQILFANDAGFALNIGQYDHDIGTPYVFTGHPNAFDMNFASRLSFWQASGDKVCVAAATTTAQLENCLNSGYVLSHGYIGVPAFVAESQLDTAQVSDEICPSLYGACGVSHNPTNAEGIYAGAFGTAMAAAVADFGKQPHEAGFAPDKYMHEMMDCDHAFIVKQPFPGGSMSARDAFDLWFTQPTAKSVVYTSGGPGVKPMAIKCND
jgi:hypothetical protein